MFGNCQRGGSDVAFPDVCLTPPTPVPVTYPNIASGPMGVPGVYHVMWGLAPAHNMRTVIPLSNGDNAGVALGVASGMVMGPSRHLTAAYTLLVGGMPATRMTSMSLQNSTNASGVRLFPSQLKVAIFAP
ncbi:MAG: DUF4150 domain-containing protein [Gammaproteobacteria bacterium]|nr:DUF4150 domain-containing protein [Gammaproteobacteria bacterium]